MGEKTARNRAVLSTKQRRVIACLMRGSTKGEAAESVGVRPATVSRWMGEPLVRAALSQSQDATLAQVSARMADGANDMLGVLQAVAKDTLEKGPTRVRAARAWLGMLWRSIELGELSQRVAALEARMGGKE